MARSSEPNRYASDAIKDLIRARGLEPGDLMSTEAELVVELGVSRSSIREAVRTLTALDILEVRHGTGTFVGQLSLKPLVEGMIFRGVLLPGEGFQSLREIIEVRTALDQALAPRIVERLASTAAPELQADVDAIVDCAAHREPFAEHDRSFHLHLAERLGNQLYGQLVAAFWDIHRSLAPQLGVPSARALKETADAHVTLLQAGLSGDLRRYQQAVREHYEPLLAILDTVADRAPTKENQ